ncbi:MAG: hypothetical protein JWM27_3888 [Gemmatimonadetes bacterium]|nr:hypothetical protein [Gemmatimonadota bacterium]
MLTGLGVFATLTGAALALSDAAASLGQRVAAFVVSLAWSVPFALVMAGRTRWLRTRGIYQSYACLREAVSASFARPAVAPPESEALLRWLETHNLQRATFLTVYEYAQERREAGPEGEREFRWVAEIMYRLLASDLHRHTAHVREAYHPGRSLGITLIAAVALAGGAATLAWALGPVGGLQRPGVTAAILCLAMGVGLLLRRRWAVDLSLAALLCGELALLSEMLTGQLPEWTGLFAFLPIWTALYLFRRRHWFERD